MTQPSTKRLLTEANAANTYSKPSDRGTWAKLTTANAANTYNVGDVVTFNRQRWQCTTKHTTGASFKADQSAGKWVFAGNQTGNTIGLFAGALPIASRPGTFGGGLLSNGTDTSATARTVHIIRTNATDIRLVFSNISSGGVGPNAITVQAAIEPPVTGTSFSTSGTYIYPVTFNGANSILIQPGASIISDPVPMTVLVGQAIYIRTGVSVTAGQKWPQGMAAGAVADEQYPLSAAFSGGTQEGVITGSIVLSAGGNIPAGYAYAYSPAAILGTPTGTAIPQAVALIGDSIVEGSGETFPFIGYSVRACNLAGLPYVNPGVHGTLAANFLGATLGTLALQPAAGCTLAIEEYGRNDVTNGSYSAVQIETNKVNIWKELSRRGITVTTATITPRTNSTDNWRTTTNQTLADPTAIEAVRVAVNTWIRAGGPIDSNTLAPVAVGTAGALLFGMPGHPCAGFSEVAWLVETAHDSGIWQGPDRTVTDAAMTSGQNTITSATAAFTSADVGKTIWISGAGTSGAAYKGQINAVNSATQITLQYGQNAATTVSGATLNIGIKTDDGTHPNTGPHITIANAFTLAT